MQDYKTVLKTAVTEFTEKRSRFIAHVSPVQNEAEALAFLAGIREKHREASHNVYAYICRENHIGRYSDDGEPGGTAGMPVMHVLTTQELTDVCVVVTRYFGGTLLGAGGLVRAYGKSAADGIAAAGVCDMIYSRIYTLSMDYGLLGKIQYILEKNNVQILSSDFGVRPALTVCTAVSEGDALLGALTDASGGSIDILPGAVQYCPRPQK